MATQFGRFEYKGESEVLFKQRLNSAIQGSLRKIGWELKRTYGSDADRMTGFLRSHKVATILDVGANIGQFAKRQRSLGFDGTIISFEPQSAAYAVLQQAAANDDRWIVADRCAVGAESGEVTMNISANSVSSSALPMLETHEKNAPAARYIGTETAPVIRLDDCPLIEFSKPVFLKIDTQGFEQQVLAGAQNCLAKLTGVQLELSLAPLYEGQGDFVAILAAMKNAGFSLWDIHDAFSEPDTGRLLQVDALFFRD